MSVRMTRRIEMIWEAMAIRSQPDSAMYRRYLSLRPGWTKEEEAAWNAAASFESPVPFVEIEPKPETWRDRPPLL